MIAAGGGAYLLSRQPDAETAPAPPTQGSTSTNPGPGGGRLRGPESAAITLVEFGDYQCPSCAYYHPIVTELMRRYPQQLRLEFHHFPLIQIHPYAMAASLAAEAAGEQGRYWEMHDLIFEHQDQWSRSRNPEPEFLSFANRLGLNSNQFMQAMRSPDLQSRILQDVVRAREAQVDVVPAFFIRGRRIPTPGSIEDFVRIIDAELKANP
jgi:protein-disulfide isomerase